MTVESSLERNRKVPCPRCGALAGQWCRTQRQLPMRETVHRERFAAAMKMKGVSSTPLPSNVAAAAKAVESALSVTLEEDTDTDFLKWIEATLTELNPDNFTREDALECSTHAAIVLVAVKARLARR